MDSNKSRNAKSTTRAAVTPQRRHGKERVATLLEVGAALIAEKGYEAATMAEIAGRAGSPIGSLYRFFPSKDLLADALIQRYVAQTDEQFARIATRAKTSSIDEIVDALLDFTVNRRGETKVIIALLEARADLSAKRQEFRKSVLKHIAATLTLLAPTLPASTAKNMAVILFHNMKLMKALKFQPNIPTTPGAVEELRRMNRLYIADRLAPFRRESKAK
jgi:AcrR family transcriptional regulator